ncbi:hypothetical protein [Ruegeria sp. HKCCA5763]|uniref:hypothetical protein n=1 Tax=Ruegeria sp. HKCCA5763 TaxID=2682987 RepID=UPI001488F726|nr:hypothetical protein [Ruegeria sp. HKCCA5763]
MRRSPLARTTAGAATPRTSLSQQVGKDVASSLHGAGVAILAAKDKAAKLASRSDIASLVGDLERLERDLIEVKATADWLARGKR